MAGWRWLTWKNIMVRQRKRAVRGRLASRSAIYLQGFTPNISTTRIFHLFMLLYNYAFFSNYPSSCALCTMLPTGFAGSIEVDIFPFAPIK